jgi:hypothetical protein
MSVSIVRLYIRNFLLSSLHPALYQRPHPDQSILKPSVTEYL